MKETVSNNVSRCKSLLLRQSPYSPVLPVKERPHAVLQEVLFIPPENELVPVPVETDVLPPVVPEVDPSPLPSEP